MNEVFFTILLLLFAMVMFFWEKIPVETTAIIAMLLLIVTGILSPQEAFSGFLSDSVLLFMPMFVIGAALFETGVATDIGNLVIKYAKSERQTIVLIMLTSGLASGFLSNTGTAAIFIPIITSVAASGGYSLGRLLMPLVAATAMGGNLSLLGSPPNMLANSMLGTIALEGFGVLDFFPVGFPLLIVGIFYYVLIGYHLLPATSPESDKEKSKTEQIQTEKKEINLQLFSQAGAISETQNSKKQEDSNKKLMASLVLLFTVLAMVFESVIGIDFYVSAWIGAVMLIVTKTISGEKAINSLDMSTILLFVGTLSMGTALEKTGAGQLIANATLSLTGDNPVVILGAILLICIVLSNFMSNTASAALMMPIGISIATSIGADPKAILLAIVIGCSCAYATPIGSPPNTMVYNLGGYKFSDYTKVGLPLIFINFIFSMILLPLLFPFYP